MSISQAIRYVPATKNVLGALYINCYVKPNARQGSGILSVDQNVVELAVSAQAREGEANKAVIGLLSSVLKVPKSGVEVVRGMKSREKTVKVETESLLPKREKGKPSEVEDEGTQVIASVRNLLEEELGTS